jgi:hypothetical protein
MSKRSVNLLRRMSGMTMGTGVTTQRTSMQVVTLSGAGASETLTPSQSGALIVLGGSNASTITLPAVESGLYFEVFAETAFAHVINFPTGTGNGAIYDNANDSSASPVDRLAVNAADSITLANAAIGDSLSFWCDGAKWYVKGWLNDTPTIA